MSEILSTLQVIKSSESCPLFGGTHYDLNKTMCTQMKDLGLVEIVTSTKAPRVRVAVLSKRGIEYLNNN